LEFQTRFSLGGVYRLHERGGDGAYTVALTDVGWPATIRRPSSPQVTTSTSRGKVAQEGNAEFPAHLLATAMTEVIRGLAAVGAGRGPHTFKEPENLDLHLLEYPQPLGGRS